MYFIHIRIEREPQGTAWQTTTGDLWSCKSLIFFIMLGLVPLSQPQRETRKTPGFELRQNCYSSSSECFARPFLPCQDWAWPRARQRHSLRGGVAVEGPWDVLSYYSLHLSSWFGLRFVSLQPITYKSEFVHKLIHVIRLYLVLAVFKALCENWEDTKVNMKFLHFTCVY